MTDEATATEYRGVNHDLTTTDGTRLHVEVTGPDDAPATVVLIHGWTLTKHTWDDVRADLVRRMSTPFRLVRFDLRGHGRSDPAPTGSARIEQCADDLVDVITAHAPTGRLVLVGHSMGGMTLMALTQRHPELVAERVAGIGLVATSGGGLRISTLNLPGVFGVAAQRIQKLVNDRWAAMPGSRLSKRPVVLAPGLRWLLFGRTARRDHVRVVAQWVADSHPRSMASYRQSIAEHERLDALAAWRSIPTVVHAGQSDRLTPPGHSRRIVRAIPHATLHSHDGAGHMLPMEHTDEVAASIADLLRTASS